MRAVGFSSFESRRKLQELLTEVVLNSDKRAVTINNENMLLGEFSKNFAEGLGIAVCGEFDEEENSPMNIIILIWMGTVSPPMRMCR